MTPLLLGGLLLHDSRKRLRALLLFCLACLAKEHALIFPALVLAWELTRTEPAAPQPFAKCCSRRSSPSPLPAFCLAWRTTENW